MNKTGQTLNPALPDQTLTWVPFVYMGTVEAYVLNESSDGVTDASDEASQATDSSETYGYTYEHSLFLSRNYLFQNTSATWNDLNGNGLIFGTNHEAGRHYLPAARAQRGKQVGIYYWNRQYRSA